MIGQSARGGKAASRPAATIAKRHEAPRAYRKHAYQIGGTAATPSVISASRVWWEQFKADAWQPKHKAA